MEIFDISSDVFCESSCDDFPRGKSTFLKQLEKGDECNVSAFFSSSHGGTHIVAPSYCLDDGLTVDKLDLSVFVGSCKLIKVPEGPITGEYVENNFPRGCQRLIIKSDSSACFLDHGALCAVNLGYKMIGIDSPCISAERNRSAVYRTFFYGNVGILEGLDLENVPEGNYSLVALPIKSVGLESAPARAVLIKEK